jgi:hypothetical protein
VSWAKGGLSGLGGEGAHDSTPHDSTQGRTEQRSTVHQLFLSGTYQHNCTFNELDETFSKTALSLEHCHILAPSIRRVLRVSILCVP